jgi:hypothetical protein
VTKNKENTEKIEGKVNNARGIEVRRVLTH